MYTKLAQPFSALPLLPILFRDPFRFGAYFVTYFQ